VCITRSCLACLYRRARTADGTLFCPGIVGRLSP
jgi:hypothetical protein